MKNKLDFLKRFGFLLLKKSLTYWNDDFILYLFLPHSFPSIRSPASWNIMQNLHCNSKLKHQRCSFILRWRNCTTSCSCGRALDIQSSYGLILGNTRLLIAKRMQLNSHKIYLPLSRCFLFSWTLWSISFSRSSWSPKTISSISVNRSVCLYVSF